MHINVSDVLELFILFKLDMFFGKHSSDISTMLMWHWLGLAKLSIVSD